MRFIRFVAFFISYFHLFLIHSQSLGDFEQIPGSPFAAEEGSISVAFSPLINGRLFAAVANVFNSSVSVYAVDQTTGFFTPVTNSPFAAGTAPVSIAFSPLVNGSLFAAVTNQGSGTVSVYAVDQTTGLFTPVTSSPFAAGSFPVSVAFSPLVSGNLFAAVTDMNNSTVSVYAVNQTTGFFTPVGSSPFTTGDGPSSVAFSPLVNGSLFAAVANQVSDNVSVYAVNQTTGLFTPVTNSPFATGNGPSSVAFSPLVNGSLFAAVANSSSGTVSVYAVDQTTGLFTPVTNSPFAAGTTSFSVAFSPLANGSLFAAVTNQSSNNVSVYAVDQTTGLFTPVTDSPFTTGNTPSSVAFSPLANGSLFAAVANAGSNTVSVYNVVLSPTVTDITPSQGPSSGGTIVTITGTQFTEDLSVLFGTTSALFTKDSETQITAISPPGSGTVDITVTTPAGTSTTSSNDQFTYIFSPLPPPPPPPLPPPRPPTHAKGCQKIKIKENKIRHLNVLKWKAPANDIFIVEYRVYRDKSLSRLAGTVSSNKNLRMTDLNRLDDNHVYYIISVNIYGDISEPVKVKARKSCESKSFSKKQHSTCHCST